MGGDFFGAIVKAGEATPCVPRPLAEGEPGEQLHITGCSIPADCDIPAGTRVSLMLHQDDDPPICVTTLTCGANDSMLLSLMLDSYAEFNVISSFKNGKNGKHAKSAVLHVHGAYAPVEEPGEGEDDGDEDDENMSAAQMMQKRLQELVGQPSGLGQIDNGEGDEGEDDDEDDDDEDDEEDKIQTRFGGRKRVEITQLPVRRP
jgi:hypothetical protein